MQTAFDRARTLQDLEQSDWGEPPFPSSLVRTCHALRRKPLDQFTTEDLRIMIGQAIGLPYLVPMAIEMLGENPLVSGDFYPGDLLKNVLQVKPEFWREHKELWGKVEAIVAEVESLRNTIDRDLLPAAAVFRAARTEG